MVHNLSLNFEKISSSNDPAVSLVGYTGIKLVLHNINFAIFDNAFGVCL